MNDRHFLPQRRALLSSVLACLALAAQHPAAHGRVA
jgi:hypothetical protein